MINKLLLGRLSYNAFSQRGDSQENPEYKYRINIGNKYPENNEQHAAKIAEFKMPEKKRRGAEPQANYRDKQNKKHTYLKQ